jgi:hypothetical protein
MKQRVAVFLVCLITVSAGVAARYAYILYDNGFIRLYRAVANPQTDSCQAALKAGIKGMSIVSSLSWLLQALPIVAVLFCWWAKIIGWKFAIAMIVMTVLVAVVGLELAVRGFIF